MGKQTDQGTRWETRLVAILNDRPGVMAWRRAKGGQRDESDVQATVGTPDPVLSPTMGVVAWRRLVNNGGARRVPDGEREVVILTADDFARLLDGSFRGVVHVQCKAAQAINTTRVLAGLRSWMVRTEGGTIR